MSEFSNSSSKPPDAYALVGESIQYFVRQLPSVLMIWIAALGFATVGFALTVVVIGGVDISTLFTPPYEVSISTDELPLARAIAFAICGVAIFFFAIGMIGVPLSRNIVMGDRIGFLGGFSKLAISYGASIFFLLFVSLVAVMIAGLTVGLVGNSIAALFNGIGAVSFILKFVTSILMLLVVFLLLSRLLLLPVRYGIKTEQSMPNGFAISKGHVGLIAFSFTLLIVVWESLRLIILFGLYMISGAPFTMTDAAKILGISYSEKIGVSFSTLEFVSWPIEVIDLFLFSSGMILPFILMAILYRKLAIDGGA